MIFMTYSLYKGLNNDAKYFAAKVNPTSIFWTGEDWKGRLNQMMNQTQEADIVKFLKHTALPAMRELKQELTTIYEMEVQINNRLQEEEPALELVIHKETMRDFVYGIKSVRQEVAEQLVQEDKLPHIQQTVSYAPVSYFADGRTGYDVQYMRQKELIADILKQYDRYLNLLAGVGQELMGHEQTELGE